MRVLPPESGRRRRTLFEEKTQPGADRPQATPGADQKLASGASVPEVAREFGVNQATYHQESFFEIPGRGRQQTFTATFIHRISDGKVLETWRNADDFGRLLQLGARIEPGTSEQ
jgi:SnoaL-like polyketide cyclase